MTQKQQTGYDLQRGQIQESAIKALVTDKLFRSRVERNRKGKGSYQRNAKHRKAYERGEKPFKSVQRNIFKWVFYGIYRLKMNIMRFFSAFEKKITLNV